MEMLFILGVTPVGVTEVSSYMSLVQEPPVPKGTLDIGLRTEPNLELMISLEPSLIVYSSGYGPSPSILNGIAPSHPVVFNKGDGKPLTTTRESLLELGYLINRSEQAENHIKDLNEFMDSMREKLRYHSNLPLLMMSIVDERHVMIFGKGSLFNETLEILNLKNAWSGETNFWGSSVIGVERLASVKNANVICFVDNDESSWNVLRESPIWKNMSFIKSGRFARVPMIWFYGGTLTAMRFCMTLDRVMRAA